MRRDLDRSPKALRGRVRRGRRRSDPSAEAHEVDARRRVGGVLLDLRKQRGLTQRQLAARAGLQQGDISRIEAGSSNPTLSTLAVLARALDAEISLAPRWTRARGRGRPGGRGAPAPRARAPAARRGSAKKKFLCLISAGTSLERMTRAEAARHLAQYRALTERLRRSGKLVAASRLLPPDAATTVRVRKGRVAITDGPFAETKELIGGYLVIEASDRAEAVRVASRIPGARIGSVEVRPIAEDAATLDALGVPAGARPP